MSVNYDLTEALAFGGDFSNLSLWKVGLGYPTRSPICDDDELYILAIDMNHVVAIVDAYQKLDGRLDRSQEPTIVFAECLSAVVLTDPRATVTKLGNIDLASPGQKD